MPAARGRAAGSDGRREIRLTRVYDGPAPGVVLLHPVHDHTRDHAVLLREALES